ncbi:hypothetical protein CJD36_018160 [Flavipsychrobacter stenotrophus]|uniref:RDD domain-containing protein n=1 Tax=Flavipsychrobacter stenotrophus TaxID=2077091 RepID=A0A2S7SSE9_9BACT|nr:RDD family protein [Flavipsychrobacter stenotrophus]PQJ09849.1 hypothetical protein CJD36_018160 [Flavipsychrobacter stenotrophus]
MPIITISTPFNIDLEFKVATFGKRVLAWLVDILVIFTYYYLTIEFIVPLFPDNDKLKFVLEMALFSLPVLSYQLVFEILFNGQTIGKRVAGIKIIDSQGKEPTWGQYIIRFVLGLGNYFIYIMPFLIMQDPRLIFSLMFFYIPDVITFMVTPRSQRVGDLAAGTVVIDAGYKPNINETIYKEIEVTNYTPLFPQVMRLTDRDINGIRNLLDVKRERKENDDYMLKVVAKIKSVLSIDTHIGGYDFLEQLLYDYNYLAGKG